MPRYLPVRQRQTGLSLLEVLVATLVLSAGLLGLAGLQIASMKTTHNSYQMQQATWMVHDLLERMRANKTEVFVVNSSNVPTSTYLLPTSGSTPVAASTYCSTTLAKDCSTVTDCTHAQVATFDLYRVMCGYGAGSGSNGVLNTLMNGQMMVSCPTGDCHAGVRVRLQWDERNASNQAGTDIESFNISLDSVL